VQLSDVDLTNLDMFERHQAWDAFDVLRREAPVFWNAEDAPNKGFWAITRHADIVAVDRDSETFTSTEHVQLEEIDDELMDLRRSMLETDGLRHRALRKLLSREFGGRTLQKYEDFLRDLSQITVDAAFAKGEFDFVRQVSADFPIQVLARMLGVPREHTGKMIAWGNQMVTNSDPDYTDVLAGSPESEKYKHLPFRSPASLEVFEFGRALARERKGADGRDLISLMVNRIPEDKTELSPTDFDNYFLLLVIAGNETTRHAISHSMLALIEHPAQLALLQEKPDLIPHAVEEFLRWASPIYHFRRTATKDVEIHGKKIRKGDKVVMWFPSGNRDDEVFNDPYAFDVTRRPIDHVTFGKGSPHFCMGNMLARLEIRLMFEALLPRLDSAQTTGEVTRVRSNFINGIKKFPVKITEK